MTRDPGWKIRIRDPVPVNLPDTQHGLKRQRAGLRIRTDYVWCHIKIHNCTDRGSPILPTIISIRVTPTARLPHHMVKYLIITVSLFRLDPTRKTEATTSLSGIPPTASKIRLRVRAPKLGSTCSLPGKENGEKFENSAYGFRQCSRSQIRGIRKVLGLLVPDP